jgi:DNA-binding transcriptional LysR family regulator
MRINYEISDIEAFLAVAERLSYAAAAEVLHLSPSSVSRRVQKLEKSLDRRLFNRSTRDVRLTIAGAQLLVRAKELIDTMTELQLSLRGDRVPRGPTLTVSCVPSVMRRRIPRAFKEFLRTHPHTRFRLLDLASNEALEAVAQRQADFGISYLGHEGSGLEFVTLEEETFVLVVRHEHPFAQRSRLSWRELDGQSLISPWKESGIRVLMDQALAKSGTPIRWVHEVRHVTSALFLVESGLGITAVPESLVADRKSPELVAIPLIEPVVKRAIVLAKPIDRPLRPIAQGLWDILLAQTEPRSLHPAQ